MIQYFIDVVIPKRNRSGNHREYFITATVNRACFSLYTLPFRIGFYRIDKLTKEAIDMDIFNIGTFICSVIMVGFMIYDHVRHA